MSNDSTARSQAALDADILEDQRRFYESSLDNVDVDHAEGFVIHMQDPTATAEQFVDTRAERTQHFEQSLNRVQAELDQHLRTHRETLASDPVWGPQLAEIEATEAVRVANTPKVYGQWITQLHAHVAVNQAREARHDLNRTHAAYVDNPDQHDDPANVWLREQYERARMGWEQIPWSAREALPLALADALVWADQDERAAQVVAEITGVYRENWGVLVDTENLTVTLDPNFDPRAGQAWDEAVAVWAHESPVLDIVAASTLAPASKEAAVAVLTDWIGDGIDPGDPRGWLDTRPDRYAKLVQDLAAAPIPDSDRAQIRFLVDYLGEHTDEMDLLATPPLVDPGEEARGRIPSLLTEFAARRIDPARMTEEISVMTPEDQHTVREIGRAIVAGHNPDLRIWPGYANRDEILDELKNYAGTAGNQTWATQMLLTWPPNNEEISRLGVHDEIAADLPRMAATRAKLQAIATGTEPNGLAPIERAHLAAVLADIDAGRVQHRKEVPELMWADERSRRSVDLGWQIHRAVRLATRTEDRISDLAQASSPVERKTEQSHDRAAAGQNVALALYNVAGGLGLDNREETRREHRDYYRKTVDELDKVLTRQGVAPTVKEAIHAEIHEAARQAGHIGRQTDDRDRQWVDRTQTVVTARDDAQAQRRAAEASCGKGRSRSMRTDHAARQHQQLSQVRAAARQEAHAHGMDR
ncbi:hypothetical protein [Nocardia grenadensis]|uniref:hypothetical protein n=1 Tax=Nocardia grenadensis TaxID=931537 RepID=UPI0007A5275C|nr:hypothetical protein [Nocardia grenadensis]